MTFQHTVIWLDHNKAQVIYFDLNQAQSESVKTHSAHPHPHVTHGDSHGSPNTEFFKEVADALKISTNLLVVGPGEETKIFVSYLTEHLPAIATKIKGVETVDHPSEGQLQAYARKHFLSSGGLR